MRGYPLRLALTTRQVTDVIMYDEDILCVKGGRKVPDDADEILDEEEKRETTRKTCALRYLEGYPDTKVIDPIKENYPACVPCLYRVLHQCMLRQSHPEAPKRSRFPGLRGFQPSGSYPRATDKKRFRRFRFPVPLRFLRHPEYPISRDTISVGSALPHEDASPPCYFLLHRPI